MTSRGRFAMGGPDAATKGPDATTGGSGSATGGRSTTPADEPLTIALYDYGAGNLHSLAKALEGAGADVVVTSDWHEALSLDALVLPGVGAFGQAAAALPADRGSLRAALAGGLPCLGICLGMQLFFERSDEGDGHGIGLVGGAVRELEADVVPHMGWNDVEIAGDPLFEGIDELVVYYANSYVCEPDDDDVVIARSSYGDRTFAAGIRRANTWGVQFHPEKSSRDGHRIIANFVREAETVVGRRTERVAGRQAEKVAGRRREPSP